MARIRAQGYHRAFEKSFYAALEAEQQHRTNVLKHWRDTLFPKAGAALFLESGTVYGVFEGEQREIGRLASLLHTQDEQLLALLNKAKTNVR